jgi:hypothetical protein
LDDTPEGWFIGEPQREYREGKDVFTLEAWTAGMPREEAIASAEYRVVWWEPADDDEDMRRIARDSIVRNIRDHENRKAGS